MPVSLLQREIEHESEDNTTEKAQEDYSSNSVKDLLVRAERLYKVRDPASQKISEIKSAILARVNATFDNEQLKIFDSLDGYAYRNPEDVNEIIVSHPDSSLRLRVRKTKVTNYRMAIRSINDEIARLTSIRDVSVLIDERTNLTHRITSLQWALSQINTKTYDRQVSSFDSVLGTKIEE